MSSVTRSKSLELCNSEQARAIFEAAIDRDRCRTDWVFAKLMVGQWLAGIAAALWLSPKTWIGDTSQVHLHVWVAILLGGVITGFPVYLVLRHQGHYMTRHVIACAQMLTSALLIHLSGGRIETHFHVFGSLAFLAFYRDWRVLMTATVVVAMDHLVRGLFWPQSVFGVITAGSWRWVEHAGWVLFEDFFLLISIRQGLSDMIEVANRQAELETINEEIEAQIIARTEELTARNIQLKERENHLRLILESEPECVKLVAADGTLLDMNPAGLEMIEAENLEAVAGKSALDFVAPEYHGMFEELNKAVFEGERLATEFELIGLKGTRSWVETHACPLRNADGRIIAHLAVTRDITERRNAQFEMEKMHKELVAASRQAGMAEVATGILHNVGNVLNSVNTASECLTQTLRRSKSSKLERVVKMLQQHEFELAAFLSQDPKGRQLPLYISHLADQLNAERVAALEEIGSLKKSIDHIKDIVSRQQSYAKFSKTVDDVCVTELVEDAIRMNSSSLMRHGIQIIRKFDKVPLIRADNHKVIYILINLIANGKQACDSARKMEKRMELHVGLSSGKIRISVVDNGIGIAPENLTQIFAYGFTTKEQGHGFGLHSSALAARELGGDLTVHSDGLGQGATFTLELPLIHATAKQAA